MLNREEIDEIEKQFAHYAQKRAAGLEALKIIQHHRGWVSDELLQAAAGLLEMSADELDGLATFYNHIYRKPVGRHVILVCNSVSCWIMGYDTVVAHLAKRLGIGLGETTPCGRFTLLPHVCLGCCDHAPAMMIDDDLFADLDPDSIDRILATYE